MSAFKSRSLWLSLVVAAVFMGAISSVFVFSGTSGGSSGNPCRVQDNHYDVRTVVRFDGETVQTGITEVSPDGFKLRISEVPSGLVTERIRIADRITPSTDRAVVGAAYFALIAAGTRYERTLSDGNWSDWGSERVPEANTVSGVGEGVCGHDLSAFPPLTREGTERINGVKTTKYSTSLARVGEPGVIQLRVEIWVDNGGRLRRRTIGYPPARQENEYTFMNFGKRNTIVAPLVMPLPTLSPTSTPLPGDG